jgi:arylsulfate sulfotransferase
MRWLLLGLLACHGDDVKDDAPGDDDDVVSSGETGSATPETGDSGTAAVQVIGAPSLVLVGEPAPLTAILSLVTDVPTVLTIELDDGERTWSHTFAESSTQHEVPVVGARSLKTVSVTAVLTADGGTLTTEVGTYSTPELPFGLGEMGALISEPGAMEPGYTLMPVAGHAVLVDAGGEVVWLAKLQGALHELLPAGGGLYRYLSSKGAVRLVDLAGTHVGGWHAEQAVTDPSTVPVDVLALHHDVQQLPDGTYLSLSVERRLLDYPTSETDPNAPTAQAWVAGDIVVNFAADGTVLDRWPLLDLLDPSRIAYDGVVGNYWEDFAAFKPDDIKDWTHGNSVSYDPVNDDVIVGMRHQDAVAAIDRSSGELVWVLAPPANWSGPAAAKVLAADASVEVLPYHMHGAKITPSGTLVVFDNGNNRASAYEPPSQTGSRAAEYAVDPVAGTFGEVWSYGLDENLFSGSLGDADVLPQTDNVLITWGNIKSPDPRGVVRIQEVTRSGQTVFDLWLPEGTVFRAQRVPGLYP